MKGEGKQRILLKGMQFLKNPGKYKSVSAYAPIANPSNCQWGKKAFSGYLNDKSEWADYDATELVKKWEGGPLDILIDVVRLEDPQPSFRPLPCPINSKPPYSGYLPPPFYLQKPSLTLHRAHPTTSTTKANCCRRTSKRPHRRKATAASESGSRMATTIAISPWRASQTITSGMRRGICLGRSNGHGEGDYNTKPDTYDMKGRFGVACICRDLYHMLLNETMYVYLPQYRR